VLLAGAAGDGRETYAGTDMEKAEHWYVIWQARGDGPLAPFETALPGLLHDCRMHLVPEHARLSRVANALLDEGRLESERLKALLGGQYQRPVSRSSPLTRRQPPTPLVLTPARRRAPASKPFHPAPGAWAWCRNPLFAHRTMSSRPPAVVLVQDEDGEWSQVCRACAAKMGL
jgi:hypothetical protein